LPAEPAAVVYHRAFVAGPEHMQPPAAPPAAPRLARVADRTRDAPLVGSTLRGVRGALDRGLTAVRWAPLSTRYGDARIAGFLRHRGFVHQLRSGQYETYSLELFLERVTPGTTVVDGGSHIGLFGVAAALRTGDEGIVYAFEPSDYNRAALALNVRRNRLENVRIVDRALAERPGEFTFHVSRGTIANSLVDKSYVLDARPITVRTTTVDDVVPPERADELVMKLDLEGAEERALLGAAETLNRCRRGRLIVEHSPTALRDGGSSGAAIVDLLRSHGFVPSFVDEDRRELVPVEDALPHRKGNLVADKG
jgi:FkbM family methyltransferase